MRKNVIVLCNSLSILLIVGQFKILPAITMFILFGTIPGTNYSLPASIMLIFYSSAALLLTIYAFYIIFHNNLPKITYLPKRRYRQL
jgi:hypothetical protein